MVENGSNPNWPSFDTIVASGANGAIPHGDPEAIIVAVKRDDFD